MNSEEAERFIYLSKVFDVEGIDPVRLQCHCIMMDLFMYKIKPMYSAEKIGRKQQKPKVL